MKIATCLSLLLVTLAGFTMTGCDTSDFDRRAASVNPPFPPAKPTPENSPVDVSPTNPSGVTNAPSTNP